MSLAREYFRTIWVARFCLIILVLPLDRAGPSGRHPGDGVGLHASIHRVGPLMRMGEGLGSSSRPFMIKLKRAFHVNHSYA